jgi:cytochrome c-type biogenesis protein CcmH/NrfG
MSRLRHASLALLGGLLLAVGGFSGSASAQVPSFDATVIYPTEAAFRRAIAPYERALAARPTDAEASYWLGYAYWETSALALQGLIPYGATYVREAIRALERTVRLDPKHLGAWLLLAEAYDQAGEAEKSAAAVDRAIALSRDLGVEGRAVPPRVPRP